MKVPALAFWGRALAVWLLIAALETAHRVLEAMSMMSLSTTH